MLQVRPLVRPLVKEAVEELTPINNLVNQNISQWTAPYASAGIAFATITAFPNHALGKTFYRINDDSASSEGAQDSTEFTLRVGERYEATALVDTALSLSTSNDGVPIHITNSAYSEAVAIIFDSQTKVATPSNVGTSFSNLSGNAIQISGAIWKVTLRFTVDTQRTVRFGSWTDLSGGSATGNLYIAEPVLKLI